MDANGLRNLKSIIGGSTRNGPICFHCWKCGGVTPDQVVSNDNVLT